MRTSLFTDNPHEVGTKSLESGLSAEYPTPQGDEKSAFIAHVISPIMHVCQLFLSILMTFCIIVNNSNRFVAQSAAFGICNGTEKF